MRLGGVEKVDYCRIDYKKFIIIIIIAFSMVHPPVGTCEVLIAERTRENK